MRRAWPWTFAALALAAAVHLAVVWSVPRVIMAEAMRRMIEAGGVNAAHFPPRVDATSRAIVRPSPDLLYASCAFDLGDGPVRLTADVPDAGYWSLSLFAANTDNFFVVDDRDAGGDGARVDLVLVKAGAQANAPPGARVVEAPTTRGIVLTRTLIDGEERVPFLDAARRTFRCAPL
ncbi:MAG: DUF1254 domain-containing protein [Myxococcota bacterium]|jgi:uncharacterized membrane protein|nr:DUF1254 domain-containing protein [Myxococcota bacterium]